MKGKENVLGEVYLAFTMYNLRRSLSIFGFLKLIKLLRAIFERIFAIFDMRGVIRALNAAKNFKCRMLHGVWCKMIIYITGVVTQTHVGSNQTKSLTCL